ncbi:3-octaprenyl-4-hydroxybenzoate carboxy-lyase [Penicillium diatomitis]|uniref:3-octaprenyl-4-hydroxybenzoate carboxy-lyase n=1 Tax=Penicillium diatomitis TaxID=2819901 RepID=A0A9W9WTC8_9EURO|nr:3-octaprenyl-4-hydroxybenzoate carboxy-lyase [Penicillium diatomitis]KAJ5475119.1 3-octaprenyl-4-hydroxybenzoate carboxy-lyase [Penicillium diatomitis]
MAASNDINHTFSSADESVHDCVEALQKDKDLVEINDEIDLHLEAAAITRLVYETDDKAPLLSNTKGRGKERVYFAALGLKAACELQVVTVVVSRAIFKVFLIDPFIVTTGPVKQNSLLGDEIDLNALPAPMIHKSKDGKFVQTHGMHVVQSTDKERKDAPRALCFGRSRRYLASSMPIPDGINEADYVGAMTERALELVKNRLQDGGTLFLTEIDGEGPFGEMNGYVFPGDTHPWRVYTVNKITYRHDLILPISACGSLTNETHIMIGALAAAAIRKVCQLTGLSTTDTVGICHWCGLGSCGFQNLLSPEGEG